MPIGGGGRWPNPTPPTTHSHHTQPHTLTTLNPRPTPAPLQRNSFSTADTMPIGGGGRWSDPLPVLDGHWTTEGAMCSDAAGQVRTYLLMLEMFMCWREKGEEPGRRCGAARECAQ